MRHFDRIRVLLIDDNPEFAFVRPEFVPEQWPSEGAPAPPTAGQLTQHTQRVIGVYSRHDPRLAPHFEAQLLESAEAAKEYRDLCLRLETLGPRALGEHGWIPEIILVDYDLSQGQFTPADLGFAWPRVSPLFRLREQVARMGLTPPGGKGTRPDIDVAFGERDRSGCYAGGLIAASLAAHPCVPIPTTVQSDDQVGRDTLVFEWLLRDQFFDAWRNRGGKDPDMREVVAAGVQNWRRRLEEQVQAGDVLISLADLARASESAEISTLGLHVESRYCRRHLPLEGLFVDVPVEMAPATARDWAQRLLQTVLGGPFGGDYAKGRELASALLARYDSLDFIDRYRLSDLFEEDNLPEEDDAERTNLLRRFGVSGSGAKAKCTENTLDLETVKRGRGKYSERARRWAALFVMVHLSERATSAAAKWTDICKANAIRKEETVPEMLTTDIGLLDVYLALFPCPEQPVKITQDKMHQTFLLRLRRIGEAELMRPDDPSEKSGFWDLALKISDVLDGQDWNHEEGIYGLLPGERRLLQAFASDLGFARDQWPTWLSGQQTTPQ